MRKLTIALLLTLASCKPDEPMRPKRVVASEKDVTRFTTMRRGYITGVTLATVRDEATGREYLVADGTGTAIIELKPKEEPCADSHSH